MTTRHIQNKIRKLERRLLDIPEKDIRGLLLISQIRKLEMKLSVTLRRN